MQSRSFKYSLPNLHKSLLSLKLGICLRSRVSEFTELKNVLPKSSYFNSVDYSVWGRCTKRHCHKISGIDELKRAIIECWAQLILDTLTPAIDQLPEKKD